MATAYALLRTKPVQTWAAQGIASFLSKELHTTISIGGLDVDLPGIVVLEKLYVADLQQDTLFYAGRLGVSYRTFSEEQNKLELGVVRVDRAKFFLKSYAKQEGNNLDFIIDYFSGDSSKSDTGKAFTFKVNNVLVHESAFIYKNEADTIPYSGVNFSDIDVRNLDCEISAVTVVGGAVEADLNELSLTEKSGFVIKEFMAHVKVNEHEIEASRMHLKTEGSDVRRYFAMRYRSWDDYDDFFNNVRFYINLENSWVSAQDIAYFAPALKDIYSAGHVQGQISGPLSHLSSKSLQVEGQKSTYIQTSFDLKGLPDPDHFLMDVQIKELHTEPGDLRQILRDVGLKNIVIPPSLDRVGDIYLKGSFKGYYNNFKTKIDLKSAAGDLLADGEMQIPKTRKPATYNGFIAATDLDLGAITGQESYIGKLTGEGQFEGKGFALKELYENAFIQIEKIEINQYTYENLNINGTLDRKLFTGAIAAKDKNLDLDFDGSIDFNQKIPAFNFRADVNKANLQVLQLYDRPASLSTSIDINLSASNLNNINGSLAINGLDIQTEAKRYQLAQITLSADTTHGEQNLHLRSDISDLDMNGRYDFGTIISATKKVIRTYIPSYNWGTIIPTKTQDFDFKLRLKNTAPVTELFYPELNIGGINTFQGHFNSDRNQLSVSGSLASVQYKEFYFRDLIIDQENSDSRLDVNVSSSALMYKDSLIVHSIDIANTISKDHLFFNVKLADYSSINTLDLNGQLAFMYDSLALTILPSELSIDQQPWQIKEQFSVLWNEGKVIIHDFALSNKQQELAVSGTVSAATTDALSLHCSNLNLETFNQFTRPFDIQLAGVVNGDASISGLLGKPMMSSKFFVSNLVYNQTEIGERLAVSSDWNEQEKQLSFSGNVINNTLKTIDLYGKINTTGNSNFDVNIEMTETDLALLEPFVDDILSSITGNATANLKLSGSFKKPKINGTVKLNQATVTVDYLKTRVSCDDAVNVTNNFVQLDQLLITDAQNNTARANGSINLNDLTRPLFDISVNADNFLCLNTGPVDNSLYYGTARATGFFGFKGPIDNMKIAIQARTNKGTQFYIPLSDQNSIGQQSFISFVNKKDSLQQTKKESNFNGISLNFDLDVTEDAQVQLIFDEKVGDIIKGRGDANLKLLINTLGDFEMYGEYEISEGEYLFTLQNLVNKRLKVAKGGTIRWDGNPYDAQVNLSAIYQTSAQVIGLYQAAEYRGAISKSDSSKRVTTNCLLNMKNSLFTPDISFGLDFPRNAEVRTELAGYLNNQDNVNTQVLSLLIANRFTGNLNATGAASGGVEVISNQVSNLLSSVYKGLDININSLNGAGGSLSLFDDRVIINGNLVTYNDPSKTNTTQQRTNSSVTGDVSAEYKINKSGTLRAKAFNKIVNNDLTLSTEANQNVQGLGLLYRAEFDSFEELWRRIWGLKPKEREKQKP